MCNLNSLLNITFIQLSTRHDCFSLAHFHLIVISLWDFDGFHLPFLSANSISFSRFLTVLLQIFSPVPTLFSFTLLDFFLFRRHIASPVLSRRFDASHGLLFFPFFSRWISFVFATYFRHSWLENPTSFALFQCRIVLLKELQFRL